ncbi:MAG: hypothetical protein HWQ38_38440 [Nostoc sp. NMS7]|uniref:hypothetical protein n=1 Tax=unclassified Nostoc TaxID=2593658 RepID=UPI0025CDF236|nr:hypothetical protein [Nostoc sp. NMS7]MBN3952036.1 hypothetical protein [Nostoc sp. NMS7]
MSDKISTGLHTDSPFVEPTEEQYLVINALEALNLLVWRLYDEDTGYWHFKLLALFYPCQLYYETAK